MGRRCCCDAGCLLVENATVLLANDFAEIFNIQGNFTVAGNDDDPDYFTNEIITFTGSANLTLSRADLIFGGDNFAITFGKLYISNREVLIDNFSDGDQVTETLTFTIGASTITTECIRVASANPWSSSSCSFTVNYNSTLLYTKQNNGSTDFDIELTNLPTSHSILKYKHYLIRKDENIYYYIEDYLVGVCVDTNINTPINFSYSFTSTNSSATIAFDPGCLEIWKPDKWWKLARYQNIPKIMPTNPSSSDANDLYNAIAYDEAEDEGCESPETTPLVSLGPTLLNKEVKFSELSPEIAIQFSGFKGGTHNIAAVPVEAYYYDSNDQEVDCLDTIYDNIAAEEDRLESINGLRTPIIDLDGIMTTQAASWQGAHYTYSLKWINGAQVTLNYNAVSSQILNGVTGGNKVTFQQMIPVTVMQNNEWYYTNRIDEYNNSYHQGFRGYNASWGRYRREWDGSDIVLVYYSWAHVGGSYLTNKCRLDPFAYYYNLYLDSIDSQLNRRTSSATDTFAIFDTTLEFRRGIVAPDIDVNLSPHGIGVIDFIFNKPDTSSFSVDNWRTPHIVNVSNDNVLHYGASHGTTTTMWYETGSSNPQLPSERDTTSSVGGYFKLQYTTVGNITAETDRLAYVLEDQFGAKSKGIITIHFTGDDTSVEKSVIPATSESDGLSSCSDYDTLCEVKCKIPFAILSPDVVSDTTLYLHYVHDGKTCQLSDLINVSNPRHATLKIPTTWTSIDGTLQDTVQATFVNPVHTDCDLAHDFNFGLENSFLSSGEPDNLDHIIATVQLWNTSTTPYTADGQPFTFTLSPTEPVGCPSSLDIGLSHKANISTVYKGTFQATIVYDNREYIDTEEVTIGGHFYQSIPYGLSSFIREVRNLTHHNNHYRGYEITKLKLVYISGKEIEIDLHALAPCSPSNIPIGAPYDYPDLVLGDFYND